MHKKTGLGAGLVNAPGGRVEPGESPLQAAVRETIEEVYVTPIDPRHAGDLYFRFTDGYSIRGYVFVAEKWEGEPGESTEADPFWCGENDIPYDGMWADDSWWLPHLLAGRQFSGRFVFDGETMLSLNLDVEGDPAGIPPAHRLHGVPKERS
jgi:8-oxo-dGTP diphosphatase